MDNYTQNYFKAVYNPLPQLNKCFNQDLIFLKSFVNKDSRVVDFGCGIGRPARDLSLFVKEIFAFDNDDVVLERAKEYCNGKNNIIIEKRDVFNTNYLDNSFDLVYATYNLIGCIDNDKRLSLIKEMARVAKVGAKIIIVTWLDNEVTTNFLKEYYPAIGVGVIFYSRTSFVFRQYFFMVNESKIKIHTDFGK
jgi:ubiquinone/menaquinone biosynthesis C-methylase UbiE